MALECTIYDPRSKKILGVSPDPPLENFSSARLGAQPRPGGLSQPHSYRREKRDWKRSYTSIYIRTEQSKAVGGFRSNIDTLGRRYTKKGHTHTHKTTSRRRKGKDVSAGSEIPRSELSDRRSFVQQMSRRKRKIDVI